MSILKDLPELIKAEVISQDTADRIEGYYKNKGGGIHQPNCDCFWPLWCDSRWPWTHTHNSA